jgi:photoactive yellow protein
MMDFRDVSLGELDCADLDDLDFGVIRMNSAGEVVDYNTAESRISGLSPEQVIGKRFFEEVGLCMHNFMVGHKYDETGEVDELVDYVLTLKMAPTPVTLRILKSSAAQFRYLLVRPK